MKSIALVFAIIMTSLASAAGDPAGDAAEYFGAPADFLGFSQAVFATDATCGAEDPSDFFRPENTFHAPASLASGVDPIVRAELFLDSGATARVRKKLGKDFEAALSEVVRVSSDVAPVRAVPAYEAASHAKVASGAEFLAVFRRLLATGLSGGAG